MNVSRVVQPLTNSEKTANMDEVSTYPRVRLAGNFSPQLPAIENFDAWRTALRHTVLAKLTEFVSAHSAESLGECGVAAAGPILSEFVDGGKCLRSTFMYLGWLCGARDSDAALSASASLEMLHAFALLQDDVMDDSPSRRGRPAVHLQFANWHARNGLSGCSRRFGESAAVLLGDLCLIWAEQMLRECGLDRSELHRVWPRYDAMRTELAVGQFADLAMDLRNRPTMDSVLGVARMKSGNYTVRRPLEIGAAMAGCDEHTIGQLGEYGCAVGEAFQLRDDILGIFGSPAVTGKPNGGDLLERKATSVMVTAQEMADATTRREFGELMNTEQLDDAALERWRGLIFATGAVQWIEELIDSRIDIARNALDNSQIDGSIRAALTNMAGNCTQRAA